MYIYYNLQLNLKNVYFISKNESCATDTDGDREQKFQVNNSDEYAEGMLLI